MPNPPDIPPLPAEHPGLRNLIGDALVAAGGIPDTIPVVVTAQAGVLADAVLTALPDLLAAHTRHLAGLIHDATRADRDRNPGPGPQSDRHYARRGGMISARQVLDRYADQLDQQTPGSSGQPATPTPADPWPTIARLTAWLDHHNGSSTPETTLRILKVQEEAGEVAAAWIGRLGQNPRKGVTHTTSDVMDELCDVIVAAMVALATLSADPGARFERAMAQIATVRLDTEPRTAAPEQISAILRSDGPLYPSRIGVYCDACGTVVEGEYVVSAAQTRAERLNVAREHMRAKGWQCDEQGDYCPTCQTNADAARTAAEQNAGGEQK